MSMSKDIDFDVFMSRIRSHSYKQIFQHIAHESADLCGVCPQELFDIIIARYEECGVSGENGVAIFDVKSQKVKNPVMFIATLEQEIDLNTNDSKGVDILVGVISPESRVSEHLQRLASTARLFRSSALCNALRETSNIDEMKMLFMPTQDWIVAA